MAGCTVEDLTEMLYKDVYNYELNVAVSDENGSFKDRSKINLRIKRSKVYTIIYLPLHLSVGG